MIKKFFLAVLLAVAVSSVYFYIYVGAYKDVQISLEEKGPFHFVYLEHIGAYHFISGNIQEVEAWAAKHNLPCPSTYGEFLDDPNAVDQDRLRSHVGCILTTKPNAPLIDGSAYEERPKREYVVARFSGAPGIGSFKVYPKITEYLETQRLKNDGPAIEIYNINGDQVTTEYLIPVAR